MHTRFNRIIWVFKEDFTGSLAKWLVKLSPYTVPDNLEKILIEFSHKIPYSFDSHGMAKVSLSTMTQELDVVLCSIPDVVALNEPKNKNVDENSIVFVSRYSTQPKPDDDFITITALARNITCDFAEREDAECWLEKDR